MKRPLHYLQPIRATWPKTCKVSSCPSWGSNAKLPALLCSTPKKVLFFLLRSCPVKIMRYNTNSLYPLNRGRLLRHIACAEAQLLIVLRTDLDGCFPVSMDAQLKITELQSHLVQIASIANQLHKLQKDLYEILEKGT